MDPLGDNKAHRSPDGAANVGVSDRLCWFFMPGMLAFQDLLFRVSMSGIQSESIHEHFDKNWWQVDFPPLPDFHESFFGQLVFQNNKTAFWPFECIFA